MLLSKVWKKVRLRQRLPKCCKMLIYYSKERIIPNLYLEDKKEDYL